MNDFPSVRGSPRSAKDVSILNKKMRHLFNCWREEIASLLHFYAELANPSAAFYRNNETSLLRRTEAPLSELLGECETCSLCRTLQQ
jgi:hypothetical protein